MSELQNSRPIQIALAAAVVLFLGFFVLGGSDEAVPPAQVTPPPTNPDPTTPTNEGPTGQSGETGATGGDTRSRNEIAAERRRIVRERARAAGLPTDVYAARRAGKIVVIFFWEPRSTDDQRVNDAVEAVDRSRSRTTLFKDRISNTSRYDGIAEAAKVNRTPSIILLFRSRAKLIEGFIDKETITQKIDELVHP